MVLTTFEFPLIIRSLIALSPNKDNQNTLIMEGTKIVPKINSLMVLPRETLAINMPTNGDQDIHHAQ